MDCREYDSRPGDTLQLDIEAGLLTSSRYEHKVTAIVIF